MSSDIAGPGAPSRSRRLFFPSPVVSQYTRGSQASHDVHPGVVTNSGLGNDELSLCRDISGDTTTPNALFAPNTLTTIITDSTKNGSLVTITARARAQLSTAGCVLCWRGGEGETK